MNNTVGTLKEQLRRWVFLIGVAQILFGCLIGFIPPTAVPWFRGIVMAHIEFTANGVLMVVVGLLVREMRLGATTLKIWFATLVVGTWTNGTAGLIGAFAGQSSRLMPTLNQAFPAPAGLDSPIVTGLLTVCGITIMLALVLTLVGLAKGSRMPSGAARELIA